MGFMTVPASRDDEDLIKRIAGGDRQAFSALFERRMNEVFRFSYSLLLDHQLAEDVTQEAFIRLWHNAGNWRPEASVKTWLLTIARNLCLDIFRKRKNDLKKHRDLYKDHLLQDKPRAGAAERLMDREKYEKLMKNALFLLPERQREAITLVYYLEVQNSEAARIMGLRTSAFDSLLARARRTLRERLEGEGNELKGYFYGTE
jgi:RNA polymerase sigma-70 factor, ECF subfamily